MRRELHFGDNLDVLRDKTYFPDESIDLIYLDPPFNSNASYNMLFKDKAGTQSEAQITAFDDTWTWGPTAAEALDDIMTRENVPLKLQQLMPALKEFLGYNDMLAYLTMMAVRLVELHRVLKDTGSLYLHCDPTASHYLKLVLDAVFGMKNYRAEISWRRSFAHSNAKQGAKNFGSVRDIIYFYTKSDGQVWNQLFTDYDDTYVESAYRHVEKGTNRRYRRGDLTAAKPGGDVSYLWRVKRPRNGDWVEDFNEEYQNPKSEWEYKGVPPYKGRYWGYSLENMQKMATEGRLVYASSGMPEYKRYLDEMPGVALQNDWEDLPPVAGKERLGYPTQKPQALLERIINASSNPGDVVLDPFCGCGTAVDAAETLERQWVGIDVTHLAINLIERRMKEAHPHLTEKGAYKVYGTPTTMNGARRLFRENTMQFEKWAVSLIPGAREFKLGGGDGGIDGIFRFADENRDYRTGLLSVKGGKTLNPAMIRDLRGVVERETNCEIGIFICLHEPTQGMRTEAASAGFYEVAGKRIPKLQIATIEDLLDEKLPVMPGLIDESAVFKKAKKAKVNKQGKLL